MIWRAGFCMSFHITIRSEWDPCVLTPVYMKWFNMVHLYSDGHQVRKREKYNYWQGVACSCVCCVVHNIYIIHIIFSCWYFAGHRYWFCDGGADTLNTFCIRNIQKICIFLLNFWFNNLKIRTHHVFVGLASFPYLNWVCCFGLLFQVEELFQ